MHFSFADGIYIVLIVLFSLIGSLLILKKKEKNSNLYLGLILLLFGYAVFCRLLENSQAILKLPHFVETDFALFFLSPSLFLFYTQTLALKKNISGKYILLNLIPFVCATLFLLPVFLLNTSEKINYILTETSSSFHWRYQILNTAFFTYSVVYLIYILHITSNNKTQDSEETQVKETKWIRFFAFSLLFIQFCAVLVLIFSTEEKRFNYLPIALIIALAALIIELTKTSALMNPIITRSVINNLSINKIITVGKNNPAIKIDIEHYALQLDSVMKNEKPYMNQNLSIKMLADMISIPSYQLSVVINQHFKKSFFDYINQHRIDEAKEKLLDNNHNHLKVDAIGETVGFKSRSSFFASFKKNTTMTPVEFRKKMKNIP